MEPKIRYTLSATERLKSRKLIDHLFKSGVSFSAFPFRVIYLLHEGEVPAVNYPLQAGFTASSKNFKHATDRNRIKRLMREAYRLQKNNLFDLVNDADKKLAIFFIYNGNEIPEYTVVHAKMQKALKQVQKLLNENIASNT
ncbi:MAG: ribonuclease P protein component [Bacteroidota bacterium]